MTKKSHARQERDRIAKEAEQRSKNLRNNKEHIWDEINQLHNHFTNVLNSNVTFVSVIRDNMHLQPFFKEPHLVANYINTLGRDHNEMVSRLNAIYEKHKDKTGVNTEHNDTILAFGLGNEYSLLGQQIEAIINPTIAHLQAFITEAEVAYNESLANTDKNVVSDVAYTETTTA